MTGNKAVHLDGSTVSKSSALHVETLGVVAVGVDLVRATRARRRGSAAGASSAEESLLDALVEAAVAAGRKVAYKDNTTREFSLTESTCPGTSKSSWQSANPSSRSWQHLDR